jgi:hypothetical protein
MRYYTLKAMEKEGLFEYLKTPKSLGEIMAQFNYVDSDYTRDLFDTLSTDPHPTILKVGENYRTNPEEKIPVLEDIIARTDEKFRGIFKLAIDLSQNIPLRLRGQPTEFAVGFEMPGREMMQNFDDVLGLRMYTVARETAELWVHTKGQLLPCVPLLPPPPHL